MVLFSLERRWVWGELIEEFELAEGHDAIKFDPFEGVPLSRNVWKENKRALTLQKVWWQAKKGLVGTKLE